MLEVDVETIKQSVKIKTMVEDLGRMMEMMTLSSSTNINSAGHSMIYPQG